MYESFEVDSDGDPDNDEYKTTDEGQRPNNIQAYFLPKGVVKNKRNFIEFDAHLNDTKLSRLVFQALTTAPPGSYIKLPGRPV